MDEFLNSYHFPKLNEEQKNDLNSLIFSKEIEEFMNSLKIYQPKSKTIKEKKSPGPSAEFYQTFKGELTPAVLK